MDQNNFEYGYFSCSDCLVFTQLNFNFSTYFDNFVYFEIRSRKKEEYLIINV